MVRARKRAPRCQRNSAGAIVSQSRRGWWAGLAGHPRDRPNQHEATRDDNEPLCASQPGAARRQAQGVRGSKEQPRHGQENPLGRSAEDDLPSAAWLNWDRRGHAGAARRRSHCGPWGRGRAIGTCPRGCPRRASRPSRCGGRPHPRARTRSRLGPRGRTSAGRPLSQPQSLGARWPWSASEALPSSVSKR